MENLPRGICYILLLVLWDCAVTASVTYDHKAILVNGQRKILFSGSIHYPRSTPEVLSLDCFYNHQRVFIFHTEKLFVSHFSFSLVAVDVARPYSKGQRWRLRRYSNLCVLEWT